MIEDYKKITIDSYNKMARPFAEKFRGLLDLTRRYEFTLFEKLVPGKKILDLGCGGGDHSAYYAEKGYDVTSVDLSEGMIALCKEKGLKDVRIMDIEDIDFPNNTFDGVWAVSSLLHVPKKKFKKVVDDIHRIMKDNGILYVCVKEGDGEEIHLDENFGTKRFFSKWREDELKEQFKDRFEFIESRHVKVPGKSWTWIQAFFRKN